MDRAMLFLLLFIIAAIILLVWMEFDACRALFKLFR